ncbi:23S rRNA (guanosine(2251)-2'-O)-methyltransferase RlmB [Nitriliruptoraceae bacterium ZYF776]|nr:23S rRNA (guanosine(2251)-2'-O)-methyltransferase RlmB [Profundirhabdus halotolerans]
MVRLGGAPDPADLRHRPAHRRDHRPRAVRDLPAQRPSCRRRRRAGRGGRHAPPRRLPCRHGRRPQRPAGRRRPPRAGLGRQRGAPPRGGRQARRPRRGGRAGRRAGRARRRDPRAGPLGDARRGRRPRVAARAAHRPAARPACRGACRQGLRRCRRHPRPARRGEGGRRGPARRAALVRGRVSRPAGRQRGRRPAPHDRLVVGRHPVRELLRAGATLHRIQVAASRDPDPVVDEVLQLARTAGVPVDVVAREDLDERAGDLVHQGIVATAPPFPTVDLATVLARADAAGQAPLLVALDGVTDPHNLGAIARTAEAVGAHGLLLPGRRSATVTPTAEKSAAGALAHLPVAVVGNLARALEQLRDRGVWSLGLDGDAEGHLADHPLAGEACVLVVGAEGEGLARLTRERCDALVSLPMHGHVGSLNASVAAGVALYTLLARRG